MFSDILDIKEMIDLVIKESYGLTHKGLVAEMQHISKVIDTKIDNDIEEMAAAYEQYDNAMVVANG